MRSNLPSTPRPFVRPQQNARTMGNGRPRPETDTTLKTETSIKAQTAVKAETVTLAPVSEANKSEIIRDIMKEVQNKVSDGEEVQKRLDNLVLKSATVESAVNSLESSVTALRYDLASVSKDAGAQLAEKVETCGNRVERLQTAVEDLSRRFTSQIGNESVAALATEIRACSARAMQPGPRAGAPEASSLLLDTGFLDGVGGYVQKKYGWITAQEASSIAARKPYPPCVKVTLLSPQAGYNTLDEVWLHYPMYRGEEGHACMTRYVSDNCGSCSALPFSVADAQGNPLACFSPSP